MDKHSRQFENEKQWIGTIIKESDFWETRTVNESFFYSVQSKNLYKVIEKIIEQKQPVDISTFRKLNDKILQSFGGVEFVEECKRSTYPFLDSDYFRGLEKEIQTYKAASTIIKLTGELPKKEEFNLEECRAIAENIQNAVDGVTKDRVNFKELLKATSHKLLNMDDSMSGVDTGYSCLNGAFDGWQEGDLILIGARPSMGKTALTINFALNSAANPDNHVTYLPAETGEESIIKRAIAILGELPVNAMRNPNKYLSEYDKVQFAKTVDKLGKLPLHIEELHDIREIRQLARETRKANPTKRLLFIIDHLGHLNCGGKQYASRTLEFEDYCMQLKAIAKEYKVAVMLLSQLSREVEKRPNKRPMNSDLRDSGSIEQIADLIAFLYRDNYYLKDGEKKPQDVIEFIISKNRDGGVGTRFFEFIPNTNKVVEL